MSPDREQTTPFETNSSQHKGHVMVLKHLMTLELKFDLDIMVTYLHTKIEVNRSNCLKLLLTNTKTIMLFNVCDLGLDQ